MRIRNTDFKHVRFGLEVQIRNTALYPPPPFFKRRVARTSVFSYRLTVTRHGVRVGHTKNLVLLDLSNYHKKLNNNNLLQDSLSVVIRIP